MKSAIIGATGYTGSRILDEALARGHAITAIVRDISKLSARERLSAIALDVSLTDQLSTVLSNQDAVVSAFNPGKDESGEGVSSIIEAVKRTQAKRLLVVGGAGSLKVANGELLVNQPDFPPQWREGALKTAAVLKALEAETDLHWTFLSPAANLVPGERTGKFRIGSDSLLTDSAGVSRISTSDLAVAMIDEIEHPKHDRARFTVAY